ncbi:putative chromatin remodeling & transcription regulator ABTB family [Medicago truncatula]|uniref:BTB/POZ domain and ankyrin repeat-containing protein NOOT1 n=1 Tax=Medicago truncatula TaxID=3880 RepID=NOOT1_MEDTR|nr:BTB/POZ domain and ankyrin repeat-containing protein NOOT1 [Medicago truncatula]Q2HW56.1 RecName: Full=BTB/POZ domain and ankyrin repeat-containing protein NOOT1; AltName: Full=Protein NODULE ROOT 1; Short=MtNOOT1 [Medicago truncatula]ABD28327.1 BTB/POZ [Medicago truncatula]AES81230.1 BTB/POZ ankyrin repeat protein [Medicago truncatula]AET34787.1 BTB/POZ ankyrin repeat protein [Medicago truncatula]AET34789.1 BTB/POZ ankyrin repeat protein [Medicago truncatula]RHN47744.1 putative chromatin 
MSLEDSLRSLSLDYLNLLINGQAFSDVVFSVEGRLVHAHRCILAARSLFFRKFFCGPDPPSGLDPSGNRVNPSGSARSGVIPVNSVGYEVFLLMLQFLYSGQVSIVPQKHEPRPNCGDRGCWHTHCTSAVDLALDTLAAARYFGVEQLALLTQKQLASMVEKASIEDVMKVLLASRKQDMHQLWTTCSHLVAKSGLPPEVLAKHLPIDIIAKIEELRIKTSLSRRSLMPHHHHPHHHDHLTAAADLEDQKIRRMRRALDSSDVELVKLMVMGEGLNLDEALALPYAVENCSREVVKALLELGAADVNFPAGPTGKTPLHIAAEMVSPDMVAVLLDHHADPNVRTVDGVTPLDILRTLTSDFLFKGAVPGLTHIEPNKLRLCLELVQSAALVMSREEGNNNNSNNNNNATASSATNMYPHHNMNEDHHHSHNNNNMDSRLVYLNLGANTQMSTSRMDSGDDDNTHREAINNSMYHHHSHGHDY